VESCTGEGVSMYKRSDEQRNLQSNKWRNEGRSKRESIQNISGVPDVLIMHHLQVRIVVRIPAEDTGKHEAVQ